MEELASVLLSLERCLQENGIDFYILGGIARDMNFLAADIRPHRITRDVDLAVYISEQDKYEQLIQTLIEKEGYTQNTGNPAAVYHPSGIKVDILPFNELSSSAKGQKDFGPAFMDFNLAGLHEVFQYGTSEFLLDRRHRFKAITPEGVILLKFIAYSDKPEIRLKDMEDIGQLMIHYFDMNDEDIYSNHLDLFEDDRQLEAISFRVAGRKL